jgi:hypothetical protein
LMFERLHEGHQSMSPSPDNRNTAYKLHNTGGGWWSSLPEER